MFNSQDEARDTDRALSLTEGCGETVRSQAFDPTNESQWRSELQDIKKKNKHLPSDLALFIEVI